MENSKKRAYNQSPRRELTTDQQIRRRTLKAFAWFGLASLVPVSVWKWITSRPKEAGLPRPFRQVLQLNEQVSDYFFSADYQAPTFPREMAAQKVRINGSYGLRSALDKDAWQLKVDQTGKQSLQLTLNELKKLPKQEIVFEFKCIEGWSQIQHWGGVRFADFMERYQLGRRPGTDARFKYVGMKTPDGKYYVGIDMASAQHPQTLLCYEMNDQPLTDPHGAPLRLIIPVKYGVKNLKRIGSIWFTDEPPPDYWAERGYDYYTGL